MLCFFTEASELHSNTEFDSEVRFQYGQAPYNGAAFLAPMGLAVLPSREADELDPSLSVTRLLRNVVNTKDASACAKGVEDPADKDSCLYKEGRECMWVSYETRDPNKAIQDTHSHCLPCEIDGVEIPCWNIGAMYGGSQVMDCQMSCPHQKRIRQPQYTCSDESGFITESQCFDKGARSGSKCMYIAYEKEDGFAKSTCGPCAVDGTGGWGCPPVGGAGPEDGSKVTYCMSQCDVICMGPPDCPPTVAPPPPPPPPAPGVVTVASDPNEMLKAPAPYDMPTVNPYAMAQAVAEAAKKAGWAIGTPPPPKTYYPVVMYRKPADYLWTPGPPPSALAFPAPPGLLQLPVPTPEPHGLLQLPVPTVELHSENEDHRKEVVMPGSEAFRQRLSRWGQLLGL